MYLKKKLIATSHIQFYAAFLLYKFFL